MALERAISGFFSGDGLIRRSAGDRISPARRATNQTRGGVKPNMLDLTWDYAADKTVREDSRKSGP